MNAIKVIAALALVALNVLLYKIKKNLRDMNRRDDQD